jgi:diguanylate cyclase (GGDEF)-like protein/PAS domain S-box-containing protein
MHVLRAPGMCFEGQHTHNLNFCGLFRIAIWQRGWDVPLEGIFRALSERVDRAIDAHQLKPLMRSQLRSEQVQAVAQLAPIMAAGAALVAALVLWIGYDTPRFPLLIAWAIVLAVCVIAPLVRWSQAAKGGQGNVARRDAVRGAVLNACVNGLIWGALPLVGLDDSDPDLKLLVCVVVAGVLCASNLALLVLPQAAAVFSATLIVCSVVAIGRLGNTSEMIALTTMLALYAGAMGIVSLRHARNLVRHLVTEAQIREQKDIISLLLKEFEDHSSDWLWEFDRNGRFQRISDRFAAASGIAREQLVCLEFGAFLRVVGCADGPVVDELKECVAAQRTFSGIELAVSIDGNDRTWRLTGKPTHDELGGYAGYIGTASDVTAEKNSERRINYLAHNDALTGLLNRAKFTDHLRQSVARLERYGSPFVVLYLDLDQFKAVNDSRGHLIGDMLLMKVSKRIKATLRDGDVIARLGGDEFAVILNNSADTVETAALAQRLVENISKRYELDDETVTVGCSIGIAIAPINGTRPDQLLRNADLALYRAKAEGRGTYRFFESQMDSDVRERRMLELELRQALKDNEFVLHYQPLVSAEDNQASGFEALIRWNHPIRGMVPPAEFIPIAEQTGLIKQIGDWTIHEACMAASRWPKDLVVAVNLSARHFQTSDIAEVVREALAASGLSPQRLELEVTESLLIERPEDVVAKLGEIKSLGVTVAMDDFGTGYSSLSYLLKFPFDKIKIDKSFVTASTQDMVARDILRSIATLGQTLKIRITAEGVETQEQVEFLREIACTDLQGFYFARPLDEFDLSRYFLSHLDHAQEDVAAARPVRRLAG